MDVRMPLRCGRSFFYEIQTQKMMLAEPYVFAFSPMKTSWPIIFNELPCPVFVDLDQRLVRDQLNSFSFGVLRE
jgi:hypothetical protein